MKTVAAFVAAVSLTVTGAGALELLGQGMAPADIVEAIWDNDPDPGYRGNAGPKRAASSR